MVFRRLLQPQITLQIRNYCDKYVFPLRLTSVSFSSKCSGDTSQINLDTVEDILSCGDSKLTSALGATEELLSYLGLAREYARESEHEYSDKLRRIQTIIIDLNSAISNEDVKKKFEPKSHTEELENWIHKYERELPPPEKNIIPGGGVACASLHVARAICRRAERVVIPLVKSKHLHQEALIYLNRLSHFLFVIARIAAKLDQRPESVYIPKPEGKNTPH